MEGTYILGVDISEDDDLSAISISKRIGREIHVLKVLYGEEALKLYDLLQPKKPIKRNVIFREKEVAGSDKIEYFATDHVHGASIVLHKTHMDDLSYKQRQLEEQKIIRKLKTMLERTRLGL